MQGKSTTMSTPDAALLADLLGSLPDPLFALDEGGRFVYINGPAARFGGREDVSDLLGQPWWEVIPGARGSRFDRELSRVQRERRPARWDEYSPERDLWVEVRLFPLRGGVAVHSHDVSAQVRGSEQALSLFESLTLGVVFQDAQGHITRANGAAEGILGLSLAQLQGRDSADPRWQAVDERGEPLPDERHPAQLALREGRSVQAQMGVFNPQLGERRWLHVTAIPQFRAGETSPSQVYTVFDDVTGAHRTRADLRRSEARYARLVEASDQYVWTNTPAGELRGEQPGWTRLTGMSEAEYQGYGWAEAVHPDDRERAVQAWRAAVQSGGVYEVEQRVRSASGEYRHFRVRGVPLRAENGQILEWVGIHSDITDLKRAEARLRELNEALEARVTERTAELAQLSSFNALLLEAAGEGIFGLDAEGVTRFANPAAARILGYSVEELIGRHQHELIHHQHADGSPYPAQACPIHATLRDGQTRRVEGEVFWNSGGAAIPVEYVAAPLPGPDGQPRGAVVLFQDTSLRDAAMRELRRSNEELENFAYVASHDLQEPLRTVGSYAELLSRRYQDQLDERGQRYLEFIGSGVERMRRLIGDLLGYARLGRVQPAPQATPLDEVLNRVLTLLDASIQESGARIERGALPTVWADPGSLEQVFSNLLSNAIKFHRPGEAPRICVAAERQGPDWRIEVRDWGIGIEAEYQERIFGVFQRLHRREEYEGTGIGLAVVRKIVEQAGGVVEVESRPGQGSRFFFTLPAASGDN